MQQGLPTQSLDFVSVYPRVRSNSREPISILVIVQKAGGDTNSIERTNPLLLLRKPGARYFTNASSPSEIIPPYTAPRAAAQYIDCSSASVCSFPRSFMGVGLTHRQVRMPIMRMPITRVTQYIVSIYLFSRPGSRRDRE